MTETVAYLVGGDNWIPCFVSVHSLLDNNRETDFRIVVFSEENQDNRFFESADLLEAVHDSFTLEFVKIPRSDFESLPEVPEKNAIFPKAMYAKLLIPELFPDPPDEFLYLDADTLVLNNLDGLFEHSLSEVTVAAAPDIQNKIGGLGVGLEKQYFNAGVMYVNARKWIDTDVTENCLDFIRERKPTYMDQTALNAVLHRRNSVDTLSPKYNLICAWEENSDDNIPVSFDWDEIGIIHYAGVPKPWHYRADGEIYDHWLSYCNETPFDDFYPQHRNSRVVEYAEEALEPFPRLSAMAECIYQNL
ncbi:glycosyltransferase family 8 protein [haloarchaeon 3A1-DGR]|nr:glycosyltransferase family 8 protein [haloarchaeon 3A1-DGR]